MTQRQTNFLDAGVTFGASFLADHAGQLMQDGKRAHARTFNLLEKVRRSFPEAKPDADVEAAVNENRSLFDGATRAAARPTTDYQEIISASHSARDQRPAGE